MNPDPTPPQEGLRAPMVGEQLTRCNRCGLCLAACPTYLLSVVETDSPRGRNVLLAAMLDEQFPFDRDTVQPFFECLLCGACTEVCPTRVDVNELMIRSREQWYENKVPPLDQQIALDKLLFQPRKLTRVMRVLSFAKRSGAAELARRLGLVRLFSPRLHAALGWVDTLPRRFLRDRLKDMGLKVRRDAAGRYRLWQPEGEALTSGPRVLYFVGCASNFGQPEGAEAAIRVLIRGGCEVVVAPNHCCGFPAYVAGQPDVARRLARLNVSLLSRHTFDVIVSECAECSYFLKRYGEILGEDKEAVRIARAVRDFTQMAADLNLPSVETRARVLYHDPCYLGRGQEIRNEPRRLLTEVLGASIAPWEQADLCCGAGGFQNLLQPRIAEGVLQRKLTGIEETRAGTLVTACPLCTTQLARGLRVAGSKIVVKHIAQVLDEALTGD